MKTIRINHKASNAVCTEVLQPGEYAVSDFWFDGDDIWFEVNGKSFSIFVGFVDNIDDFIEE